MANLLLLFDIDGTLLHTNGVSKRIFCQGLSEIYERAIAWGNYAYSGQPDRQVALDLLMREGIDEARANAHLETAFKRIGELWGSHPVGQDITVYAGVREMVDAVDGAADLSVGQLTANVRPAAIGKLNAAGFDPAVFPTGGYGEDATARRDLLPKALHRCRAHYRCSFSVEKTVVIGDSLADIATARFSGAHIVSVATGFTDRETLAAYQPDLLIDDMATGREQLFDFIQSLSK